MTTPLGREYTYETAASSHSRQHLLRPINRFLAARNWGPSIRGLDYGCGNGWFTGWLSSKGFAAIGADISESGIAIARQTYPEAQFTSDTRIENLEKLGPFDLVVCLEVLAHCYTPLKDLETMRACLKPGGTLVVSTPYHGYIKNLVMAATGKLEKHMDTSWPGAYVHFFTPRSVSNLLSQSGFRDISVTRAGRTPCIAKSMIVTCSKPNT